MKASLLKGASGARRGMRRGHRVAKQEEDSITRRRSPRDRWREETTWTRAPLRGPTVKKT